MWIISIIMYIIYHCKDYLMIIELNLMPMDTLWIYLLIFDKVDYYLLHNFVFYLVYD